MVGTPEGRSHLENLNIDGKLILKWTFRKSGWVCTVSGLGYGQMAGFCECGDEPLGFVRYGDFFASCGTMLLRVN
jgi:hypothetical protein